MHNTRVFPPQNWGELPNGEFIRFTVEQALAPWWPRIFGYYLLNLGALSATMDKTGLSIQNEYSLYDADTADIMAELTNLPIQSSAIDAVVMNFLLEFNTDPYHFGFSFESSDSHTNPDLPSDGHWIKNKQKSSVLAGP